MTNSRLLSLPLMHEVLMRSLKLKSKYRLGAKFRSVLDRFPQGQPVDCSGFFRWVLIQASGGNLRVPDGSWMQREWCDDMKFLKVPYSQAIRAGGNEVYAAFIKPVGPIAGHVWIVRNGVTWESFSGKGIGNRKATHTTLRLRCYACYRIA
jgi:hypothetical protein